MKKHYLVYQITNLINQKIYIGIHCTNNLEDGYFGSGANIRKAINKYGIENFQKEILFDFDNPEEMVMKERELVDRKFIARKDVYNIKLGGEGWLTFDSISVKDSEGNCFRVHKDDERYLNGDLVGVSKGFITIKDSNGNYFNIAKDDPRYVNRELRGSVYGSASLQDIQGNKYFVSRTDPRYMCGELFGLSKNLVTVKDNQNNYFRVPVNDNRVLSGELAGTWKDRKHKEESKQKIGKANSIYQKGSGNSQYGTCWIYNLELRENKKIKQEELNSFLELGWIKGRKIKF